MASKLHGGRTDGGVYICEPRERRLLHQVQSGAVEVVAESYEGIALSGPTQVAVSPQGDAVCFVDPARPNPSLGDGVIEGGGVYRVCKDGAIERFSSFHRAPGGLAFSPHGDLLYVSDSAGGQPSWTVYPMDMGMSGMSQTGGLLPRPAMSVLNEAILGAHLGHDGRRRHTGVGGEVSLGGGAVVMESDDTGLLWVTIPNGIAVIDPYSKRLLAQVRNPPASRRMCVSGVSVRVRVSLPQEE